MALEIFSYETGSVKQKKAFTKHVLIIIRGRPMDRNQNQSLTIAEKKVLASEFSGGELKYILKRSGITRKELAHEANISASAVQKWTERKTLPMRIIETLTILIDKEILVQLREDYQHGNANNKQGDR